jgi:hypothetical protein
VKKFLTIRPSRRDGAAARDGAGAVQEFAPRHRYWRWLLAFGSLLAVACGSLAALEFRRYSRELDLARQAMRRQAWEEAADRLIPLRQTWPDWSGGEADLLRGLCDWNLGRRADAAAAFRRVPAGSRFEGEARAYEAEFLVQSWQFRAAEERLNGLRRSGRPGPKRVLLLLVRLSRMQARFDEVRSWLREGLELEDDPVPVLRELWTLDRGAVPETGLRENLEVALKRSPDDDRVWLGLGRAATLDGRLAEAEAWLTRCEDRSPGDRAVLRGRLEWARASDRTAEVARLLQAPLGMELARAEILTLRSWLAAHISPVAERRALDCWLREEPRNPSALERLATLAAQAGDRVLAAEVRRRKAQVDDALKRYGRRLRGGERFARPADRALMARLAEEAGRPWDAAAWCQSAARQGFSGQELALLKSELSAFGTARGPDGTECDGNLDLSAFARPDPKSGPEANPAVRPMFRDDAERAGLRFAFQNGLTAIRQIPAVLSGGIALLDYDGDGWLDVYCVQGGSFPPDEAQPCGDRLFRNCRDGTFEDVSRRTGISGFKGGYGHGVAVGDYDNDGHPDLFITRWRAYALYRNRGDGTFQDVTALLGLGGERDWPTSAAFADLDGDGDLDLYVCHYLKWDPANPKICRDPSTQAYVSCSPLDFEAMPDHVFRNDGGRFVDVTSSAGISDAGGRGLGVVAADLDGDGKVDLFVTNDQSANYLFRNLGGFRFEEVGHAAGVAGNAAGGYQAGMGIACGDLDRDGWPDLVVTNFYGESATLYQNLGAGLFGDSTSSRGLAVPSRYLLGFGASFLDVDNNGWIDLLTANGHLDPLPGTPYKMPIQLLPYDGSRFRDATASAGNALAMPRMGRGLAIGDLDNDGRVDALVVDQGGPLIFLHNQTAGAGHSLALVLEGTRCARDAVGARVVVTAGGRRQTLWRLGGGSYLSASGGVLHVGLGQETRAESIDVEWPSGARQAWRAVRADRRYRIREGDPALKP